MRRRPWPLPERCRRMRSPLLDRARALDGSRRMSQPAPRERSTAARVGAHPVRQRLQAARGQLQARQALSAARAALEGEVAPPLVQQLRRSGAGSGRGRVRVRGSGAGPSEGQRARRRPPARARARARCGTGAAWLTPGAGSAAAHASAQAHGASLARFEQAWLRHTNARPGHACS